MTQWHLATEPQQTCAWLSKDWAKRLAMWLSRKVRKQCASSLRRSTCPNKGECCNNLNIIFYTKALLIRNLRSEIKIKYPYTSTDVPRLGCYRVVRRIFFFKHFVIIEDKEISRYLVIQFTIYGCEDFRNTTPLTI